MYPYCKHIILILWLVSSASVYGQTINLNPKESKLIETLYLIGDAGEITDIENNSNYVVDALHANMDTSEQATLVFLGDNIYPYGLENLDSEEGLEALAALQPQIDLAKAFKGRSIFIPGNHDWANGAHRGLDNVRRQSNYINNLGFKNIKMRPKNGCGDPWVLKLNKDLVYIFIDSQWWAQRWEKHEDINEACKISSREAFLDNMESLIADHKNDQIVIFMHHPIRSNGHHGGHFSGVEHIFPLTQVYKPLYIPLPILGSIIPVYRRSMGFAQDITHPAHSSLAKVLHSAAKKHKARVIFAAGHDHNLQYFDEDNIDIIISGSAAKSEYAKSAGSNFVSPKPGYAKIYFYENLESWLEFYGVAKDKTTHLLYREQINPAKKIIFNPESEYDPITTDSLTVIGNKDLKAKRFKRFWLGNNYRSLWTTPVKHPVLNVETKKGGLVPTKLGGSRYSNTVRLEAKDGREYVLRSLDKVYTRTLPKEYQNLRSLKILKDQNSGNHPFASLAVPRLSAAAGIYHTNPEVVFLKKQRGLGVYNKFITEGLYLFEERPDGKHWKNHSSFGSPKKIIGYTDLLDKLKKKKTHIVDQKQVLRSRIFDTWIHDLDRHDDQWRWAVFKTDTTTVYQVIPRDRDYTFHKYEGFIPWVISNIFLRKLKTFDDRIKDVPALSETARHFDRAFLNELEREDWIETAEDLKAKLTDEKIRISLSHMPKELSESSKNEISKKLISRRDNLTKSSLKLYKFLSKEVQVIGTDNKDKFVVTVISKDSFTVKVYTTRKKSPPFCRYNRSFNSKETSEVRLYGLDEEDLFVFEGLSKSKTDFRIIGGAGRDSIFSTNFKDKIYVYDQPKGLFWDSRLNIVNNKCYDTYINRYNRENFEYNQVLPIFDFSTTPDGDRWLGGGLIFRKHAWRKHPYDSRQKIALSLATDDIYAFSFRYQGDFTERLPFNNDLVISANLKSPNFINFYGLGEETNLPRVSRPYHWVKTSSYHVEALAKKKITQNLSISLGPHISFIRILNKESALFNEGRYSIDQNDLEPKLLTGFNLKFDVNLVDNHIFPRSGVKVQMENRTDYIRPDDNWTNITKLRVSSYLPLTRNPTIVLGQQVGFSAILGADPLFYQYPYLDDDNGLRGSFGQRYRGASTLFYNADIRLPIYNWYNAYVPMKLGVMLGLDMSWLHLSSEGDRQFYHSYSVGAWSYIVKTAAIQYRISFLEGDWRYSLGVGFDF